MASTTGDLDRLSGVALPLILQRKLKNQQEASGEGKDESKASQDADNDNNALAADDARQNVIFTAQELEENVWKARAAIADIQKQIMWGEESYHEDTNGHGNLFRGWAEFIDAKDGAMTTGSRRLPADNRWFSSSCANDGKMPRPLPAKKQATPRSSVKGPNLSSTDASARGATAVNLDGVGSIPAGGARSALGGQSARADSRVPTETSSGRRTRKRKTSDA